MTLRSLVAVALFAPSAALAQYTPPIRVDAQAGYNGGAITSPALVPDGTAAAPGVAYSAAANWGFFRDASTGINVAISGNGSLALSGGGVYYPSDSTLRWTGTAKTTGAVGGSVDTTISRPAAGVVRISTVDATTPGVLQFGNATLVDTNATDGAVRIRNAAATLARTITVITGSELDLGSGNARITGDFNVRGSSSVLLGNDNAFAISYAGNNYSTIGVNTGNPLVIIQKADTGTNWSHADTGHPAVYVQSEDAAQVNDYVRIQHDATDGFVQAGNGYLTLGGGSGVKMDGTSYIEFTRQGAGAPTAGDCDADAERTRLYLDTTNHRVYVCNGASRAWDYVDLTN